MKLSITKYWVLPLNGGILSIIGLFIPVWYSSTGFRENLWMWGMIHHITGGDVFEILPSELFIPGLIAAILILLSSIVVIIFALLVATGKAIQGKAEKIWKIVGLFEIGIAAFYVIAMLIGWNLFALRINYAVHNFWRIYNVHIGMFTPFIGAALSISGGVVGKRKIKDTNKKKLESQI
ncbi:hypothetical protein [Candidatus Lokiarchaeum ossiferum]|uniref:hypothetical protein n=1 Tax=Candidatus Lokiarchaeum ossiferum TaxID=2951803 RepID=UPI00352F64F4